VATVSVLRTPVDGRTARAERTRAAVVDALLALITEGELRPTSARIAERAGVSLRSVFQHFEDMESLLATTAERERARMAELIEPLPDHGTLGARVRAVVDQRARVLEFVTPVRRAAILQEPFSPVLQRTTERMHRVAVASLERVFATELERREPPDRRELVAGLDAATSWEAWELWRTRQRLSVAASKRVMARTILALLTASADD
jgi:AcrR family transcriptional regulator